MSLTDWVSEFEGAVTICDEDGIILAMNDRADAMFDGDGGRDLVGTNVLDCHPEPSKTRVKQMLDDKQTNVYIIEKAGKRKLIYQSAWQSGGEHRGILELSLELPAQVPVFKRD